MGDFSWTQTALTLAISLIGYWVGYRTARYQFDLARRQGEREAANALGADLERIEKNLGESANAFGSTIYGMTFEPPTMHRWSDALVTPLAAADVQIVAGCLELDRRLHNFGAAVKYYRLAREAQDNARASLKEIEARTVDEHDTAALSKWVVQKLNAESAVEHSKDPIDDALWMMRKEHAEARTIIAELMVRVRAVAARPEPEFFPTPSGLPRFE